MKNIKRIAICLLLFFGFKGYTFAQQKDTTHIYFIINAGDQINAFYHDRPVDASTPDEFNSYVEKYAKTLKDSWVVVTGKPKVGTYDDVMKTLKRYRIKHIETNVPK